MMLDSFGARDRLLVDNTAYGICRLDRLEGTGRLPYSLKVLLENLLRNEDGRLFTAEQVGALAGWQPQAATPAPIESQPQFRCPEQTSPTRPLW